MGQNSASNYEAPIPIHTTDSHNVPSEIYKTGSLNAGGNRLTVSGTINGRTCDITVDTGSNISIARSDVLIADDLKFLSQLIAVSELSQENELLYKENAKFG